MSANRPGISGKRPGMSGKRPGMSGKRPGNRLKMIVEIELSPNIREISPGIETAKNEILSQLVGVLLERLKESRPQWTFTVINSRIEKE